MRIAAFDNDASGGNLNAPLEADVPLGSRLRRSVTPPLNGKYELCATNPFTPPTTTPCSATQSMSYLRSAVAPGTQSTRIDHTSSRCRRCEGDESEKRRRFVATIVYAPSRR